MKKTPTVLVIAILAGCSEVPVSEQMPDNQKPVRGDYWAIRYTYPAFQFNQAWMAEARLDHVKNQQKTPHVKPQLGASDLDPNAFTSLGPLPLGNPNGTAFSGRVNVIVSNPDDATVAYVGVDGGGVWKTTDCCDENTSFEVVTDQAGINGGAIGDLHLDPNDSDVIYAGTGDLRYGSYSFGSAGLLRSKDAGATWEVLGEAEFAPPRDQPPGEFPQYQAIGRVRTNPLNSEHIVVGTKSGFYFSYDDGANWTGPCLSNAFTDQRQDITGMEVTSAGVIFASVGTRGLPTPVQPDLDKNGANGIYRTDFPASGCPTWSLVSTPSNGWPAGTGGGLPYTDPAGNQMGRIDLAMAPSNEDVLYAQVANITTREVLGVWKTTDAGLNWTQVATTADIGGCDDAGTQAWYDMGMSISPTNPDHLFLSGVDLFRSLNGGDTFSNSTCGYAGGPNTGDFVHVDHHARAYVDGDPQRLLVGSDGGVYYTGNADALDARDITYTQLNNTINTIEFYSGDISGDFLNAQTKAAVGGAQDNGSSVAVWNSNNELIEAKPWTRVWGGDGIYATIEPVNGQRVYVESQFGNMGISTNGPLGSYSNFVNPWSSDSPLPFIFSFHLNKHDCGGGTCDQLMAGTYRIWETTTGGLTNGAWYVNSPNLTKQTLDNRSIINQMHYAITDRSVAIVGTNDGNVQYGFNMGLGVNTATWVDVTDGNSVLPNRPILDVVTAADVPTTGYAAVGGFDQNTPGTPGHLFEVVCDADCTQFTWSNKSGNLPNVPVNSVMVNPNLPNMVFAGTDWGLYYTEDISETEPVWFRFTAGLPSVMIWDMTIDRGATTLAVFTRSRGAFVWPLPTELIDDLIFEDGFEGP